MIAKGLTLGVGGSILKNLCTLKPLSFTSTARPRFQLYHVVGIVGSGVDVRVQYVGLFEFKTLLINQAF